MRILHINSNISLRSGIMSFLMSYYRILCKDDVQFDFLYYMDRENDYKDEILKMGGSVFKSPTPTSFFQFKEYVDQFCAKNRDMYDVIHLHDPYFIMFYAMLKKKLNAKVLISHAHSTRFSESFVGGMRNRVCSIPNAWIPDYYAACSDNAGRYIFGSRYEKKGYLIPNAIEPLKFVNTQHLRDENRLRLELNGKFVVGHIGNFTTPKNHGFIVDVFAEIASRNPNAVLVLVGDGENRPKIEKKCEELGITSRVRFLGVRSDVGDILRSFDRFLFPSLYEGLGIALVEAQAAGIPCIYSSVVPKETNILKDNNMILNLNQSVEEWADAVMNENLSVAYGGWERIRDAGFEINMEALNMKKMYESMVKNNEKKI